MPNIHRPLSAVERWYWICDQFSTLNVISRVRVYGELCYETLRYALDELQARHPLLRAKVEHDKGLNPRWLPIHQPIPLRKVYCERDDQWIHEINERELLERIDPDTGPLIRVVVISDPNGIHDLLVTVAHTIADGTTVLSLAEQWLTLASGSTTIKGTNRVLASVEELRPPQFIGDEGDKRLAEQNAGDTELIAQCKPGRVKPSVMIPFELRQSQLLHRELNEDELDAVIQVSRRHKTTVHGALTAALVLAVAHDANFQSNYFAVGSPVNFRGELLPPVRSDEVGSYVATVLSIVDYSLPFWDIARSITTDLSERRLHGHHFNLLTMIVANAPQSIADARAFMEFMEAEGPINLVSSNLGLFPFPNQIGEWKLSDAQFLSGISVNGYFVATINSSHKRLFWNFTYIKNLIPENRAEFLADNCLRFLRTAIGKLTN
ncbi:phthiocerol/phthiodiolone dimycocerosyl transferase family protein [Xenorhabdus hominickii]|uniref:Phthiocerol/phthiodiolone dimycocerosyl transferase n=1 Tax=Xenorhabdus hominickii TaxID=351679 RepID=A0A2G0QDN3_XENHO|nr:condensation domain-containing protein [Xenorhabdus hominickii]AOM41427.1 hypothetical protein A9255_13050 [Xenorhabdus hominickii]PHM57345.1 peptide synthase [Xenorhabdus hominickii]